MADRVAPQIRSAIMRSVGTKNTAPEMKLRKALHRLGFRYRTNVRTLPGSPDLVFPRLKKVIYVHGCFWHGHSCRWGKLPKSRIGYWTDKVVGNRRRDARTLRAVKRLGWSATTVWQCKLRDLEAELARVVAFLQKNT